MIAYKFRLNNCVQQYESEYDNSDLRFDLHSDAIIFIIAIMNVIMWAIYLQNNPWILAWRR